MKKLILFILITNIILINMQSTQFTLKDYFNGEYFCYTSANICGTDLGFCKLTTSNNNEKIGESVKIHNLELGSALKTLNAKVIKTEYLSNDTIIIYAYSNLIPTNVKLFNTNVNIQFAIKDGFTTIGWPLILGSF